MEDDVNGKRNYEVVVRTSGKEWGFEVDPNGKFVKSTAKKRWENNKPLCRDL
jgi:hypothetical protein